MSFEIMRRVIATEVHDHNDYPMPVGKALLLYMAHHAHDDGTGVFLKGETLAEETGYSRHTIVNQLKLLVERGWIDDTFRLRGRTTHYAIVLDKLAVVPKQLRADNPSSSSANEHGRVHHMNTTSSRAEHQNISSNKSRSAEVNTDSSCGSLQSKETQVSGAFDPPLVSNPATLEQDPLDPALVLDPASCMPTPSMPAPTPTPDHADQPGRVHEERISYSA